MSAYPHGGARPFHPKSTCITQLTLGPYVEPIWSRNTLELRGDEARVLHREGSLLQQRGVRERTPDSSGPTNPAGVLERDHPGFVINKLSLGLGIRRSERS